LFHSSFFLASDQCRHIVRKMSLCTARVSVPMPLMPTAVPTAYEVSLMFLRRRESLLSFLFMIFPTRRIHLPSFCSSAFPLSNSSILLSHPYSADVTSFPNSFFPLLPTEGLFTCCPTDLRSDGERLRSRDLHDLTSPIPSPRQLCPLWCYFFSLSDATSLVRFAREFTEYGCCLFDWQSKVVCCRAFFLLKLGLVRSRCSFSGFCAPVFSRSKTLLLPDAFRICFLSISVFIGFALVFPQRDFFLVQIWFALPFKLLYSPPSD